MMSSCKKEKWKIERIETYWYQSGRDSRTYVKITYWFQTDNRMKKELKISYTAYDEENLPAWTLSAQKRNTSLENHS